MLSTANYIMASKLVLDYTFYVYFDLSLSQWLYINRAWTQVPHYGNAVFSVQTKQETAFG